MKSIHSEKNGKYLMEIFPDKEAKSPREWDNLGTMICFHKRYNLGDEHSYCFGNYDSWEEMKEDIIKKENVHTILPLYLYDHSGITISTTSFSCNWDSGQVGWIFISKEKVKDEGIDPTKVKEYLENEVETYDQYLTGEVYGYKVSEVIKCNLGHEHNEELGDSWGFYGYEECLKEAQSILAYYGNVSV